MISEKVFSLKVCSPEEMRKIDEQALRLFGIPPEILMENAGSAIFHLIVSEIGLNGKKFCVFAGTGNNGGDALVAARRLIAAGAETKIYVIGEPSRFSEPAARNYELLKRINAHVEVYDEEGRIESLRREASDCDVFIVGLIGTGLTGEVSGIRRKAIEIVNEMRKLTVSVDIPSGVSGRNGKIRGVAVKSDYTVTFGLPKYGNILYPGYYYGGKLFVSKLSYPPSLLSSDEIKTELNYPLPLPERIKWGHKGNFGKFLAISGARFYFGAPFYTAFSFLKSGGGYSRLAAPKSIIPSIASIGREIVYIPLDETDEGTISLSNLDKILALVEEQDIDIVAVGPGMSLNSETQELIRRLIEELEKPVIVDGDGITAVSQDLDILKRRKAPTVLTPHMGEFSRLVKKSLDEIAEDPVEILRKACTELNSYIVLKGAHSLICYPDEQIFVNLTGNPGMAKAGMGDVLTGTIAAMYGIGLRDLGSSTRMGVLVHGLAGDIAASEIGEDGITPEELMSHLPDAVKILRDNPQYVYEKYFPKII